MSRGRRHADRIGGAQDGEVSVKVNALTIPRAAAIAAVLEVLMGMALLYGLRRDFRNDEPHSPITEIRLTQAPETHNAVSQPTTPKSPPPKELLKPRSHEVPQQRPIPVSTSAPEPMAQAVPVQDKLPHPMAESRPVMPQHLKPADISVTFADKVRAAVQNAVVFPMAARAAHLSGETKVSFDYKDGVVSAGHVITTSGNAILDKAAVAAIHAAHYPMATVEYAGRVLTFEIWVRFLGLDEHE